jgi:KDO2-lipid IV(A) lauroyltransferase
MKNLKYFLQFLIIISLMIFYKVIGLKFSRIVSSRLFLFFGPFFRSVETSVKNLSLAFPKSNIKFKKKIIKNMWKSYGKIFAEYIFIKNFRENRLKKILEVKGQEILEGIKLSKEPVIFVSGHFDNFELMAMHIEMSGVNVAAIYRPLNNPFLNPIMENIRRKYICEKQVQKGTSGTKKILKYFKSGYSIALMIDQRVSQGIRSPFFENDALTTTLPAQFFKKFNCKIIPIYIERKKNEKFFLEIMRPIDFNNNQSIEEITLNLNRSLEAMIFKNPNQWIWSHNRWK